MKKKKGKKRKRTKRRAQERNAKKKANGRQSKHSFASRKWMCECLAVINEIKAQLNRNRKWPQEQRRARSGSKMQATDTRGNNFLIPAAVAAATAAAAWSIA